MTRYMQSSLAVHERLRLSWIAKSLSISTCEMRVEIVGAYVEAKPQFVMARVISLATVFLRSKEGRQGTKKSAEGCSRLSGEWTKPAHSQVKNRASSRPFPIVPHLACPVLLEAVRWDDDKCGSAGVGVR